MFRFHLMFEFYFFLMRTQPHKTSRKKLTRIILFVREKVMDISFLSILIYFSQMLYFCNSWTRHKTFGFLTFPGGIEMEHWAKMG